MINNFQKKKIQILVQNEIIKHFSKDFKNYKIFDRTADKDPVQICFSIVLLSKNIEIMEKFFDKYLNVKIFDSNEYQTLNLGNKVTSTLFDTLFNKVYEKLKNNEKENLDLVIKECIDDSNISVFNLFRCQKCYDIMLINLDKNNNNNFEMKCLNCDKNYREFTDLQISNSIFSKFYCINCKNKILLYRQNYKCTTCKSLICWNCKKEHFQNCFSLNYIQLYEIGYKCEIHNSNYVEYCFLCKKNICKFCKEIHCHKTKEVSYSDEIIKNNYISISSYVEKHKNIIKYLYVIYLDRKKRNLFNGYIYEILCVLLNIDLKNEKDGMIFHKFFDEEFKTYYSKMIKKIQEGNLFYLDCMNSIKYCYKKRNTNIFEYDNQKIYKRESYIQKFIEDAKYFIDRLNFIHRFFKYDEKINSLKKKTMNLK